MFKLYGRKGAGSVATQALLEEVGAAYENHWVEDTKAPWYLAICPNGKIPALQLPSGELMFESAAMIAYLVEAYPGAHMAPAAGTPAKARFHQWLAFISSGFYETMLRFYYSDRYGEAASVKQAAISEIKRLLSVVEGELNKSGPFLCGKEVNGADIYLCMLLSWFEPTPEEALAATPKVLALYQAVTQRPAWQRTLAKNA